MPRAYPVVHSKFEFTATPIMSDGSGGATLYLRELFENYNNAVSYLEDADLIDAARQARAHIEQELASHWTK